MIRLLPPRGLGRTPGLAARGGRWAWLAAGLLGLVPLLDARPLRVGVELKSPPVSFVDAQGRPSGFTAELVEAMRATGLEIELVPAYWAHLLADFEAGRIDALANVVARPDRLPAMDFSIGHARVHGMVYRRPEHPPVTGTADFAGKRIGTVPGTVPYHNALIHGAWGATLHTYKSWQAVLDATQRGEVDMALVLSTLSGQVENLYRLRTDFVDDLVHQYRFAVHPGDRETLARLNDALAAVRHNGSFDRIYARWIGPIEPHPIRLADLQPYAVPVAAVLLAIGAIFWWQRYLLGRLARQAEALRVGEERWKFALEGAGDGMWDWDVRTGRVVRSRRWMEMLGFAEQEIGDGLQEWQDRIHPDDRARVADVLQALLAGRDAAFAIEHRLRCKDGGWKWVLNRGIVVARDAAGAPRRIIGTHTDLTARKQAEEDRLILSKLESTGVLAGGIAHDFNNLLTAILMNLELAEHQTEDRAELHQRLQGAQAAALSARSLTQQLITFARGGSTVRQPADVGRIIRESVPLVLTGSTVRGDIAVAPDLRPAEVDEGQIGQVIRNLVLNAREAMPRGGTVALRAHNATLPAAAPTVALPPGDYLHLEVSDMGEGIAAENHAKIFDPYFSTKQRGPQKGMGLGLTICHSIIQKHGGAITVASAPGRGTTFHLYLPAIPFPPPATTTDPTPPARPPGRGRHLLLMDDETAVRESVSRVLVQMGHTVEAVADGGAAVQREAGARAAGRPFDAVLLDLTVPGGMGGLEAVTAMRRTHPDVKAIVISGFTDDAVLSDPTQHGFVAALNKPFDAGALREVLDRVLAP